MSCLACLACQGASCICSNTISCCGKTAALHHGVRFVYFLFFFATSVFAWVFSAFGAQILGSLSWFTSWCQSKDACKDLLGPLAAYKITFAFAVFHLLFALFLIGVKDAHSTRGSIHNGWWGPKFLLWAGMTVGFLFLPSGFLSVYPWISLVGSIVFTVIQLFMLVDFAHTWNEAWVDKYHETNNSNWFRLLLTVTILLLTMVVAGTILMYVFLIGDDSCKYHTMNIIYISINVALVLIACIMSVHSRIQDRNPRASLLTSAVVCTYATYLVASAIFSEPHDSLCSFQNGATAHNQALKYTTLVIGALLTFVAVAFSSMRAGSHAGSATVKSTETSGLLINSDAKKSSSDDEEEPEDEEMKKRKALEKHDRELLNLDQDSHNEHAPEAPAYNYTWFHVVMLLGAMYIGCLMSNWAIIDVKVVNGTSSLVVDSSIVSVWLKIASGWVVLLLYIWTLIAPIVLPHRDFGF